MMTLPLLLAFAIPQTDSTGIITGTVRTAEGNPIAAQVLVSGSRLGALTDSAGRYRIARVPAGTHVIRARAIGYGPEEYSVSVTAGRESVHDFVLTARGEVLGSIVVSASLREQYTSETPVRTDVVSSRALRRNITNNIMDNLNFITPGVNVQVDCGVCFTNNIRINGMEGPYTAVLIDGTPIMSSLATVYGFNGLHPAMIEQVEIIRGPLSTLYGSEAMGGVINIVTKDPRLAPRFAINSFVTSHGETNLDAAITPSFGGGRLLLSGTAAYNDKFIDRDPDDFSDLPLVKRWSLFSKYSDGAAENRRLDLATRLFSEDRFGGTSAWRPTDRGSDNVYGESIRTNRAEIVGNWRLPVADEALRLWFSGTWHDQDSYYGDTHYAATQGTGFAQLVWEHSVGKHAVQLGSTLRYQLYDDNTPATNSADRALTGGVFIQDEINVTPSLTALGGFRLDAYERHGLIPAPRLALRWRPFDHDHTTIRLNAATGFRIVNLFTEDHAALTGARHVVIAEALNPERSRTVTIGVEQHVHLGSSSDVLVMNVDAFNTRFGNRIQPDYDTDPNLIVYANLDGSAVSRGVSVSAQLDAPARPYTFSSGITVQDVWSRENGITSALPFAAKVTGQLTFGWKQQGVGTAVDWTARLVGPMALPEFEGRATESPWFSEHHLQLTQPLRSGFELYGAVRNLFDYRQNNAIVSANAPFSDEFDTSYVYGPLQGRRFMLGFRATGAR